jgi:hypothetical protein
LSLQECISLRIIDPDHNQSEASVRRTTQRGFAAVFTTRTLVQIVIVLTVVVLMKWSGTRYDFSWATALAQ